MLEILRKAIVQNILALYGVYIFNYMIPLVTVPYLTRILGADGWGRYAFYQSMAFYGVMLVEYSFVTYGVREVARNRDSVEARSGIFAAVYGAKMLLALGVVLVAAVCFWIVPVLRQNGRTYGFAILWGITLGFSLIWFFQGRERIKLATLIDVIVKIFATASIFVFVHFRGEEWKVFAIYSIANVLSFAILLVICLRDTPFTWPGISSVLKVLKDGAMLFAVRTSVAIFTTGNVFLLGLFVSAKDIGFYAGAEKICRAFAALSGPVSQAIYPRLSQNVQRDFESARKLARRSFWLMAALGAASFVTIYVGAPLFATRFLGPEFVPSIALLRILAIFPFFLSINSTLSTQWMLSLGLDRWILGIAVGSAILDILLVLSLVTSLGATGMAMVTVLVEASSTVAFSLVLLRRKQHPLFFG
jgi:polysaccharide transporter, PST family